MFPSDLAKDLMFLAHCLRCSQSHSLQSVEVSCLPPPHQVDLPEGPRSQKAQYSEAIQCDCLAFLNRQLL